MKRRWYYAWHTFRSLRAVFEDDEALIRTIGRCHNQALVKPLSIAVR